MMGNDVWGSFIVSALRTAHQEPCPSETFNVPSTMAALSWAPRKPTNGYPSMGVSSDPDIQNATHFLWREEQDLEDVTEEGH